MAMPLRTIITPMAARSRLMILDMAFEPVFPSTRLISGAMKNMPPTIRIFAAMASDVITALCSLNQNQGCRQHGRTGDQRHANRHGADTILINNGCFFLGDKNIPDGNDKKKRTARDHKVGDRDI